MTISGSNTPRQLQRRDWHISGCDCIVRSDYTLLLQILQNLIGNAISYTEAGSITIECQARGQVLRIAVTDTGIGIHETDRDVIFEEFYQLDNPTRSRDRGMGLAIVRRLTTLLDIPLHLNSAPGQGSTFAIAVPLADERPAYTGSDRETVPGTPLAQRATILLIDDAPSVLHSQEMLLQAMGYRVQSAVDSNSARQLTGSEYELPDLIITDYRLPEGETGSSPVERLRDETGRRIPAIILTGDVTHARLESEPADCLLLRKPVATDDLEQSIQLQLGASTGH